MVGPRNPKYIAPDGRAHAPGRRARGLRRARDSPMCPSPRRAPHVLMSRP